MSAEGRHCGIHDSASGWCCWERGKCSRAWGVGMTRNPPPASPHNQYLRGYGGLGDGSWVCMGVGSWVCACLEHRPEAQAWSMHAWMPGSHAWITCLEHRPGACMPGCMEHMPGAHAWSTGLEHACLDAWSTDLEHMPGAQAWSTHAWMPGAHAWSTCLEHACLDAWSTGLEHACLDAWSTGRILWLRLPSHHWARQLSNPRAPLRPSGRPAGRPLAEPNSL